METRVPTRDAATAQRPSSVRWRIFSVVFLITLINLVDRISLSIAIPTFSWDAGPHPLQLFLV